MSIEAIDFALEEERRQQACHKAIADSLEQNDCILMPLIHLLGASIPYQGFMVAPKNQSALELPQASQQRAERCMNRIQALLKAHNCIVVPRIVIQGAQIVENGCIVKAVPLVPEMKN